MDGVGRIRRATAPATRCEFYRLCARAAAATVIPTAAAPTAPDATSAAEAENAFYTHSAADSADTTGSTSNLRAATAACSVW
jgi:hypothetical protein